MMESKAFLANPKHQDRASQCAEPNCSANKKKNGDCYEYPRLSYFIDEH